MSYSSIHHLSIAPSSIDYIIMLHHHQPSSHASYSNDLISVGTVQSCHNKFGWGFFDSWMARRKVVATGDMRMPPCDDALDDDDHHHYHHDNDACCYSYQEEAPPWCASRTSRRPLSVR